MSELYHFNPNHDKLGRFASNATSKSYRKYVSGDNVTADYVLNKGSKVYRISRSGSEKDEGRTYGVHTEADKNIYISSAKEWFAANYQIQLKAVKDIKVAGIQTQAKEFANLYKNTTISSLVDHSKPIRLNVHGKQIRANKIERKEIAKLYKNALKNQESFDQALKEFSGGLIYKDSNLTKQYLSDLSIKGYDAIVDINDLHMSNKPVQFIDRNKSLKTTKVSDLTYEDVDKAAEWLAKREIFV